ncbi:MAG: hypothetical protein IT200_16655 [Thermoleophilia bacterium]|nr:hypothetical protein [Thermoleophilia bacterium]
MGDDPTVANAGMAREIPEGWPGAGPAGPFAGFRNAAGDDPGRLDVTDGGEEGNRTSES